MHITHSPYASDQEPDLLKRETIWIAMSTEDLIKSAYKAHALVPQNPCGMKAALSPLPK